MKSSLGFCFLLFSLPWGRGRLSGLYVDNGIDQTLIEREVSREEKREVEREILDLLGLPEGRPKKVSAHGAAPKFLMNVYKSLSESPPSMEELGLTRRDLRSIDESDVIVSFTSQVTELEAGVLGEGKRLRFDVSKVPPQESVVSAELRLHWAPLANATQPLKLSLYNIARSKGEEEEFELLEEVGVGGDEGWLSINASGPLASWVSSPSLNRGLFLRLSDGSQSGGAGDSGLSWPAGREPFLVAFLSGLPAASSFPPPPPAQPRPPSSRSKRQAARRRKKTTDSSYFRNPLLDKSSWPHSHKSCQIQTLYVSFKDLDWQDWIIAPDGYGAFYCSGECNFPLNAHMNATNHAVVQTLVHLMNPLQVPKPCCAPTKLTAISVLYFFDESKVILKKYKNMVVKSCGCH